MFLTRKSPSFHIYPINEPPPNGVIAVGRYPGLTVPTFASEPLAIADEGVINTSIEMTLPYTKYLAIDNDQPVSSDMKSSALKPGAVFIVLLFSLLRDRYGYASVKNSNFVIRITTCAYI